MMLSNDDIKEILAECQSRNYSVGMRDISYILLTRSVEDITLAYRALFGLEPSFNIEYAHTYDKTNEIEYLRNVINIKFPETPRHTTSKASEDISFEENKAYMLKLKRDTEAAMADGSIETRDGLKILTDISVKLNDKFQVQGEDRQQLVYVNTKYDSICPRCGVEVSRKPITKEEAMAMYNLVDNNNIV